MIELNEYQKTQSEKMNEYQKKQYFLTIQIDRLIDKIPLEYQEDLHEIIKLLQEKEDNSISEVKNILIGLKK